MENFESVKEQTEYWGKSNNQIIVNDGTETRVAWYTIWKQVEILVGNEVKHKTLYPIFDQIKDQLDEL